MSNKINRKYVISLSVLFIVGLCGIWLLFPATNNKKAPITNSIFLQKKTPELALVETNTSKINLIENAPDENSDEPLDELTESEKLNNLLGELAEKIAEAAKPLYHPAIGVERDEEFFVYRAAMLNAIEEDPTLVYNLLDIFSQDPNSHMGRQVGAVLSETDLPEVQRVALDVAFDQNQYDHAQRSSALFLIADMDQIDGTTRDRLVESYSTEQDPELLQYSVIALKPSPGTAEDYTRVNEALSKLSVNDDADLRRHSAYQIAEWATNNEDLAQVRSIALNDSDINARARAIMSIAESPIKSAENREILKSAIYSTNDQAAVRKEALLGLNTYELSSEEVYEYQNLLKDLDNLIEIEREE